MAYPKRQVNVEHPSKTIVKLVQGGEQTGIWPKLMLFYGKEDFLVSWAKGYLKSALINPASEALDFISFSEHQDVYEIIAAAQTLPLMSQRKLIVIDNLDILTAQSPKDMSLDEIEALIDFLPQIPESTLMLFICSKPNKTKALYKSIAKLGICYDFTPLEDATLASWMAKRLKANGRLAKPEDLLAFAKSCGYGDTERNYNLNNLENDLKKVFAGNDNTVLSLDDMMENSAPEADVNAFRLLDASFSNNKGVALTILHNTIEKETPSKEIGAVLSFLGLLCSQLEIMLEGKEREQDGEGFYDIAANMGVNEYRLKKALASCKSKSIPELRTALDNAFQIEKDLKSGNIDARLSLELFIAKL